MEINMVKFKNKNIKILPSHQSSLTGSGNETKNKVGERGSI